MDPRQAYSLEQQGKTAEADAAWRAIAAARPSDPEPLAHIGLLEARQEHFTEAIRFYRKAMTLAPTMPGLRLNLGLAYFKNGDYEQAIAMFSPMMKAQPDDQRLVLLMGMSYYGLGKYAAATPYLKNAANHDDRNLTLQLTLAHSCLFSREFQCVLDVFHRMVELNAESAEAQMLVGEALDEMKDPVGAMREFRAAAASNPKEPNVHFGLGYLLWTKGQYAEAAEQFQAEIDNNPRHLQAMLYLADSDIQLSKMDEARSLLEQLARLDPENAMEHRDLGIVYMEDGRKDDAMRELKKAVQLAPNDVNAHWRLARLYRTMGRAEEAKVEFEKAKNLNKAEDQRLLKVMSKIPPAKQGSSDAVSSGAAK